MYSCAYFKKQKSFMDRSYFSIYINISCFPYQGAELIGI